jgi:hypothetical protein
VKRLGCQITHLEMLKEEEEEEEEKKKILSLHEHFFNLFVVAHFQEKLEPRM